MMIRPQVIEHETALAAVVELLKENGLPSDDLTFPGNLFLIYHDADGNVVGAGGLEFYGSDALLRSVAVKREQHGKKIGRQIVNDLLARGRERAIRKVFLLTETAPKFFERLGFINVSRDDVPGLLKSSSEFASVCPVSASCMEKDLR